MKKFLLLIATILLLATPASAGMKSATVTSPGGYQRVLGSLRSANFNVTTDQAISIAVAKYVITAIDVVNCSVNMTTAAGGVYPATSKGGTPIVAAGQVYTALNAATVLLPLTLAVTNTSSTLATVYLALSTPQGAPATCDVYVVGLDLT